MSRACSATILLQLSVLFLQGFEFLGHVRLHATVLLKPAVIGLFCDPNQLANFRNFLPLAKPYIRTTQLGDDLIHTVTGPILVGRLPSN